MSKFNLLVIVVAGCIVPFLGWMAHPRSAPCANVIPDPDNYSPNYRYDGLTLASAPVELSGDAAALSRLMDLQLWKFSAKVTKPGLKVACDLEVREKGRPTKVLCTFEGQPCGSSPPGSNPSDRPAFKPLLTYVSVGMMPLRYDYDLSRADKVKYAIAMGGISQSGIIENPFKASGISGLYGTPNSNSDKDIALLQAHPGNGVNGYRDITLFLKLNTKP